MARMPAQWDGTTPSREDFEAWDRVQAYMCHGQHQLAVARGHYSITFTPEGAFLSTEFDSELLTDEMAESIGVTITKQGEMTWHQRTL